MVLVARLAHSYQQFRLLTIYRQIAEELVRLASSGDDQPVIYCVPGHPAIGEASVRHLRRLCSEKGIKLRLVAGLSFSLGLIMLALIVRAMPLGVRAMNGAMMQLGNELGISVERAPSANARPKLIDALESITRRLI